MVPIASNPNIHSPNQSTTALATDVPALADFSLDVLPQALGTLLTRPKLWHLLGASLCALVCAKRGNKQPQVTTFVRKADRLFGPNPKLGLYL